MSERLIAIGDIHGCRLALERLIEAINPQPSDTVVTLGDYIDRGPDSRGVIDVLIELANHTQLVGILGNHEEMMLEVLNHGGAHHAWLRHGGVETLESYGFDGDLDFLPEPHKEFLDSLGDFYAHGEFFFTHAAYDPEATFEEQEIEMLRWYSLTNGIPSKHISGKTAVVGHTANRDGEILHAGHLICLDTYCYGGGWLTAMEMNTQKIWQADRQGRLNEQFA
ncbi:metallophosphoesterase family protein [Roseiconus lacunae]|uniref:Metallophosphoesterase family protein n=1 Tax=Roseiconus lacunae TaxID=2605694 RepID=A0ABT7PDN3_9BACT|nr:metallophosphoesterase family protein [Roseiconus lacunae]MDM4014597.1 metallophosphoesterase family protein [Roseiconus lacunae]